MENVNTPRPSDTPLERGIKQEDPSAPLGGKIETGMEVEVINLDNCRNLFGTVKVGDRGIVDHIWHTGGQDICVVFGEGLQNMAFMNEENLRKLC